MAGILRKLKISAIVAGSLSFGGAAIEKIVETGAEKAGHHWIDQSIDGSNADILKRHLDRLTFNLFETYRKAKNDENYRATLLESADKERYRDFYVLFVLSICPLPYSDQDWLKDFRSKKPIKEAINAIYSQSDPNLSRAICDSSASYPLSDEQIKSVFIAPTWNKEFWLEIFGFLFLMCGAALQMHEKGLLGGHEPRR